MLRTVTTWTSPGGAPYYTTLYFNGLVGAAAAAHSATTAFMASMDDYIDNQFTWTVTTEVHEVDPATGLTVAVALVPTTTGTGAVAGVQTSSATQWLIQWRTGTYINGREVRGRTFLPGWIGNNLADGKMAAASIALVNAKLVAYLAGPGALAQVWSPTNGVAVNVVGATVWAEMAVLRSRRD